VGLSGDTEGCTALRVWIDATRPDAGIRVFGMTLLERLLRGLVAAGVEADDVHVELSGDAEIPPLPAEVLQELPLSWSRGDEPVALRLRKALEKAPGESLLALSDDTIVDTRVLAHLAQTSGTVAFVDSDGHGGRPGAALRLEGPPTRGSDEDADLASIAERALREGDATPLRLDQFEGYITSLRRALEPYAIRIADRKSVNPVERFLFWSNYKGSTDFLTRYVYPPLVWLMVRPLARWRVHPNWVTGVDIAATFLAVPFFAIGAWLPGLLLSYLMSVLDSVDGKLARLTFRSSKLGEVLDHGLDIVHPPIWYLAWGWALGGGDASSLAFRASILMFGLYFVDRILAGVFKQRVGRSIHGITPFDERMRTFISRRNVNLPFFTAAVFIDWMWPGWHAKVIVFYLIVAWQAVCLVFHADRVVRFWNARRKAPNRQPSG